MYITETNIVTQYWPYLIGPAAGFLAFVVGVVTLENVLWRSDSEGNIKFSPENFVVYLKIPFETKNWKQAWGLLPGIPFSMRLKLLNLNWIAMIGIGSLLSVALYYFK